MSSEQPGQDNPRDADASDQSATAETTEMAADQTAPAKLGLRERLRTASTGTRRILSALAVSLAVVIVGGTGFAVGHASADGGKDGPHRGDREGHRGPGGQFGGRGPADGQRPGLPGAPGLGAPGLPGGPGMPPVPGVPAPDSGDGATAPDDEATPADPATPETPSAWYVVPNDDSAVSA